MVSAKDIIVKPIKSSVANEFVREWHYSGKVVPMSKLHFGCFLNDVLGGVMSFGPSMDARKSIALVKNTKFYDYLELNRMAFGDLLPKNSESRCISIAIKLIKKYYPNVRWILSYADGCQCGDGTIYRASGFKLTQINKNSSMWRLPNGEVACSILFDPGFSPNKKADSLAIRMGKVGEYSTWSSSRFLKHIGAEAIQGYQLRYIYFIDKNAEKDLTVPILPFSKIEEIGASMYLGKKINRACVNSESGNQSVNGGASPTRTLHNL